MTAFYHESVKCEAQYTKYDFDDWMCFTTAANEHTETNQPAHSK